jgi:hypothetical protein
MNTEETMKLALDELNHIKQWCLRSIGIGLVNENVLAAIEEALAKQEQGELVSKERIREFEDVGYCLLAILERAGDGATVGDVIGILEALAEQKKPKQKWEGQINNDEFFESLKQEQGEPVKLRRGNILRCIETDELCVVWATSTSGKTLVKWDGNNFGEYAAEQIGELFWLEPESNDVEIAAEQSDNYASFHAGVRFARANSFSVKQEQGEPVAQSLKDAVFTVLEGFTLDNNVRKILESAYYTTPQQRKPLTDEIPKGVLLAISNAGLTLLKTQHGYQLQKLGPVIAHSIKD